MAQPAKPLRADAARYAEQLVDFLLGAVNHAAAGSAQPAPS